MKKNFKLILPILFLIFTNCKSIKKGLGIEKDVPDAFLIRKIDPIERPPNFELLPPDTQMKKKKDKLVDTSKNTKSIIEKSFKSGNKSKSIESENISQKSNIEDKILNQIGR